MAHWYVAYTWSGIGRHGDGCISINTVEPWFPIGKAMKIIKDTSECEQIIIRSWQEISQEQLDEWKKEYPLNP